MSSTRIDRVEGAEGESREAAAIMSPEVEMERIMRTGTLWFAAVLVTAALLLGPAVAAGWRPTQLPAIAMVPWWLGAIGAAAGAAALLWAGCPVPAFSFAESHAQKVFCIRFGSVASAAGMALAGLTVLLAPALGS